MRVGWVGLGKLGLPVALAIASRGHEVVGYDTNPEIERYLEERRVPYQEDAVSELLCSEVVKWGTLEDVKNCDLIFVAVQTPHEPRYEGATPLPSDRKDFDYSHLKQATDAFADVDVPVVVVSTVLPGTMAREINVRRLVYNPAFIAMGTAVRDFLDPEFVLLGSADDEAAHLVREFYATIHTRPVVRMSIASAELTKVAYNTFIGLKVVFANTLMEISEQTGADVDEVTGALCMATERLISPKYLRAGMGDGGGCHPRDNIALSWLARELNLSYDLFGAVMECRDAQTEWLAQRVATTALTTGLPVVVLGKAYKAGSNLTVGSCAVLLGHFLNELDVPFIQVDPHLGDVVVMKPAVYVIATDHPEFQRYEFPEGSVVIDPWRNIGRSASSPQPSRVGSTSWLNALAASKA